MERVKCKVMYVLIVLLVVGVPLFVDGGNRKLKDEHSAQVKPENFFGGVGFGGIFPSPATVPGLGTTGPGLGSSVDFCSVPGLGCVRVQPTNPSTGAGAGAGGSTTPLPFP